MQRIIGRRRKLVGRPNTRRLANCSGSGEGGRLDGAPVSPRTNARVVSSMRLRTKRRDAASRPWQSSTICLAMIPFAKSSASPRAARVISSAAWRTRLVSGSASKSSKWDAIAMAKSPPKAISSLRRLVRSAIYSQRHSNHTPTKAPGGRGIAATGAGSSPTRDA